ncbi:MULTISPECIES: UvrD-helicase domain-containing protein [Pectobacterium]|uniref:UvrD-helicase domain-containing protein n=1 Tax=Pectobacterium TaxID=122277 RepID=UPI001373C21D|nr:ATP-dependent helicase [Pectobacterium carotovorum]QHP58882.1 ATP-dependent helicase [Pectobacterium carotovorum subsp. carotovorum]GKX40210.1 DNA helicase [Pectobacterium carotovorum subsp. carotovorum]GLX43815.1 DNA helicase [Pectobacterium carotovorum subsp. carotovorum]
MIREWTLSEGIEATDELMDLIKEESSVSILAGAGAGKTEFLAQKANYLLQTGLCSWPKRVLCLSTKKEAQVNIKERVMKRCGSVGNRFDSYTFDAFCKSIVDRFKNSLPKEIRPDSDYELEFDQKKSNGKDKITFIDMRSLAIKIIKLNPDIAKVFSISYSHVFIDEFQDTRSDQYELIKLLFLNNKTILVAVGDINQSIMLWADACPTVFRDFQNDFLAKNKFLLKNYRSSKEIQDVLSCFISFIDSSHEPNMVKNKPENCSIHVYDNEYKEADDLVHKLKELIASGVNEKDICVLTKQQSSLYTSVLRDKLTQTGINNLDMTDLQDVLKEPLGRIFSSLFSIYTDKSHSSYREFCDLYLEVNNVSSGDEQEADLIRKLSYHLSESKSTLSVDSNADSIVSSINKTLKFIQIGKVVSKWGQYKSKSFRDKVWSNLEYHLRYTIDTTNSLSEASKMFRAENCVQLMNIHKCKGLEYKVVVFLGIEDQAFWKYSPENFEDKCAIYVALSRAKNKIIITTAKNREFRLNGRYDNRTSEYVKVKEIYNFLINNCKFSLMVEK